MSDSVVLRLIATGLRDSDEYTTSCRRRLRRRDMTAAPAQAGLLGDTATRDYSHKLRLFNAFAAPELRQAIASLGLKPGMTVLDAGCGTGESLQWLADEVGPSGKVFGIDLAT